jgi:hypothetical protein
LSYVARIQIQSPKGKAGCSGGNTEPADFRQRVEDFLDYTVSEVLLIVFRAEICEG